MKASAAAGKKTTLHREGRPVAGLTAELDHKRLQHVAFEYPRIAPAATGPAVARYAAPAIIVLDPHSTAKPR